MSESIHSFLKTRQNVNKRLLSKNSKNNPNQNDSLVSLAQKKNSDSIKFTYFILKNRLVEDLDKTIHSQVIETPELRNKFYIGIISEGEEFSVEVVEKEKVINAVVDASKEEAAATLDKNPVGYFKKQDFNLKTPSDPSYKSFQKKMQKYFDRNIKVIRYLQTSPEANISAKDLYTTK